MTESIDAIDEADCDRIVADMVNGRDSLARLLPETEVLITDPLGVDRKAVIRDFLRN